MAQLQMSCGKVVYGVELGHHALAFGLILAANRQHLDFAVHMVIFVIKLNLDQSWNHVSKNPQYASWK